VSAATTCIEQAQEIIRRRESAERILPVAGATKPGLSQAPDGVLALDISELKGILEYDPAELTITARAATPVAEVAEVLAEHGQYLPFDPPLADAGATLGGAVAAATSGPNAFRHGGVRDFVIGVRLIDGTGRLVSGGGKVVKNAAGFDLPKLMVGSRGQLGVMTQLSFKVFPRPRATITQRYDLGGIDPVLTTIGRVCRGPMKLDAIDVEPDGVIALRLGGDPEILGARSSRLEGLVGADADLLEGEEERAYWASVASFSWVPDPHAIVRVPISPDRVRDLSALLDAAGARVRYSLAANVAWVAWPAGHATEELGAALTGLALSGAVLTSSPAACSLGAVSGGAFAERVRSAFDPFHRFWEG
jgi:glycolate oxidase FAD binding subunit